MQKLDLYLKNLTGKDENLAQEAADFLINHADIDLFKMLVNKSDFLFPFIRNNVEKRIEKAINKKNFLNIIKFFDCYSSYYDDVLISNLAKHANQDLTDEIFELLDKGNINQKIYSAKYFFYIPDTISLELLNRYAFDEDESLSFNSAQALGQMQDDISYDIALNMLTSNDDFDKLKAVKFFAAYGNKFPLKEIFSAMQSSKMPENIAGQIPYMIPLTDLLESDYKFETLLVIDNIILGLGEILPLSDIFQFQLFDIINKLFRYDGEFKSKTAKILLAAYSKFKMFMENQEYIFDEDKDTRYEISSIYKLLNSQNNEFWEKQKKLAILELDTSDDRILSVLGIITEYNIQDAIEKLNKLLNSENEIVICEVLNTLKSINAIDNNKISIALRRVKNPNIRAIIENFKI